MATDNIYVSIFSFLLRRRNEREEERREGRERKKRARPMEGRAQSRRRCPKRSTVILSGGCESSEKCKTRLDGRLTPSRRIRLSTL